MDRGKNHPMNAAQIVRGVQPRNTAKWLEDELEISPRQSWRIIQKGRVPGILRRRFIEIAARAVERRKAELNRIEKDLRAVRYERMVSRVGARKAAGNRPMASASMEAGSRPADGPRLPLVAPRARTERAR